jgi:hypothetical protein
MFGMMRTVLPQPWQAAMIFAGDGANTFLSKHQSYDFFHAANKCVEHLYIIVAHGQTQKTLADLIKDHTCLVSSSGAGVPHCYLEVYIISVKRGRDNMLRQLVSFYI